MIEPEAWVHIASDGYPLHVLSWRPLGEVRATVLALHGIQSHGGWYHDLGRSLAEAGFEAIFPDRRGSGRNPIDRGHALRLSRLIADQAELLEAIDRGRTQTEPGAEERPRRAVAGISWGAKIALLLAAQRPDLVDALALVCPGIHPRVKVPLRERLAIAWARLTNPSRRFPIPLGDPALFTNTPERQRFIADDPLSLRTATAGLLATSAIADAAVRRSARRVKQSVVLMLAGEDRIIDNQHTRAGIRRLGSANIRVIEYPGAHHTLEFEVDHERYARDLIAWLEEVVLAEEPVR